VTHIHFTRSSDGKITAFSATGHSGYAPAGEDIVCASVSALLQGALFSLEILYPPLATYDIKEANLSWELAPLERLQPSSYLGEVQLILNHTMLALMNIAFAYPKFVTLSVSDIPNWKALFQAPQPAQALREYLHKF